MNDLLQIRKEMKERKPKFIRQDDHRRMRIQNQDKWRKPKGIHSKIRHAMKGRRKMPSPGYKSPVAVKGLHHSGVKMVYVSTLKELGKINKSTEGIIVSGNLGMRKKIDLLKKAKEMGINVLNYNVDDKIKKIEDYVASKKQKSTKEKPVLPAKKETAKEKKQETNAETSQSSEEKKDLEEKEKNKILTKKE